MLHFLTLMAVVTNAGLCGLTGHSIYFYSPDLSYVDRLWFVAILEHGLLLVKIMVESMISPEPDAALEEYRIRQEKKKALLQDARIQEDAFKQE